MNPKKFSSTHLIWIGLLAAYLAILAHWPSSTVDSTIPPLEAVVPSISKPEPPPRKAPPEPAVEKEEKPRFEFKPGTLPELAPRSLSRIEKVEYYTALAERMGLQTEGTIVIGFRGVNPEGRRHPSSDNATNYDDTFVILKPATKQVWEMLGSTHAGQASSTLSPGGVAQIKPGIYKATPSGEFAEMPCWYVTTRSGDGRIPAWRDADMDGTISVWEKSAPTTATEILFHNGRYYDRGSSIGCQVLPPDLMERFISRVGEFNSFDFLLIDANQKL